jgi:uncharacterized protein YPO0396
MSEERFDRLEQQLAQFRDRVEGRFDAVDQRLDAMDQRFDAMDQRFTDVDRRLDENRREMRLLHEDTIGRIAATGENEPASRAEMLAGFAELREVIDRRIDPLEAAVRQHTRDIEELRRRRR